jgi:hypothetical protein
MAYSYKPISNLHGVMVSIFPSVIGSTELLPTGKKIELEMQTVPWIDMTSR